MKKQRQRGAVLIVSLIMLAVVTFIIVAYLAFAQRERASVNMSLINTETRFILDMGTAVSQAVVSRKVQEYENYQLIVSKNTDGANQENVPLSEGDLVAYAAGGLRIDARAPVYFDNDGDDVNDEFRFSLDLNRDGAHTPHRLSDGIGDPHWIGVLEDPSAPHGPDNQFVGRYAYMIVPASKTLDFNHIHNWMKNTKGEGFIRGPGQSHLDLNLAGTLRAANMDWAYDYRPGVASSSQGPAFADAASILTHRVNAGNIFDIFDLYHPHRGALKPLPANAGHPGLTSRLETAGGHSFYDLAASISTITQPPPAGKVNLNIFLNPRVVVFNNGIAIGPGLSAGDIRLATSHGMTNGARVNLFSDAAQMPVIISDPRFPDGRRVSPYDRFYVQTNPDNEQVVKLHHEFTLSDTGGGQFSRPVVFKNLGEFPVWSGVNPISGKQMHYARGDIVRMGIPDEDGNVNPKLMIAVRNHSAPADMSGYRIVDGQLVTSSGIPDWEESASPTAPTFFLDRTEEMYEIVLARLLKGSPGTPDEMVRFKADGIHADFNIHAYADKKSGAVDPNDPFAGLFGGGANPFAGGIFNWPPKAQAADVKFNPEVRRLMQLAANICDIYTPDSYPSIFRPVFEKDEKTGEWMIRQFVHEPNSSFLARFPALDDPSELMVNLPISETLSYARLGRLDFTGIPRAVPLAIGVKQAWGMNQNSLPPMINEISVMPLLKYDYKNRRIQPSLRLYVETRNPSGADGGLQLQILRAYSGKGTAVSHSQQGISFSHPDASSVNRQVDFLNELGVVQANPSVIPLEGNQFAANVFEAPLREVSLGGGLGNPTMLPISDRSTWNLAGYLDLELAIVAPMGDGLRDRLVDHCNLRLFYRSGTGIQIPSWSQGRAYKAGDEVIHAITKKRHYCISDHTAMIDDQVKNNLNQVTGLDPAKWACAEWTADTFYQQGQILIHRADVNTRLYKVLQPFRAGGDPSFNVGSLALYGGNAAEVSFQVNDPIMNGQEMDYLDYYNGVGHGESVPVNQAPNQDFVITNFDTGADNIQPANINQPNKAHLAWLGSIGKQEHTFKDPGVRDVNDWMFQRATMSNPLQGVGALGFVHRGTPWQSVYLKSNSLGKYLTLPDDSEQVQRFWKEWVITRCRRGMVDGGTLEPSMPNSQGQYYEGGQTFAIDDASDTRFSGWKKTIPLNDHKLLEEFSALPVDGQISEEDASRGLLSVNQEQRAAWAAALSGVRIGTGAVEMNSGASVLVSPSDPKLGQIVMGINDHRKSTRSFAGSSAVRPWRQVTDVLGVPQLTSDSPYLDDLKQPAEWHYEAIPRQILSLLRVEETPYFVAYVFSQSLRPKERKRVNDKWLIWNYEVVGEAAARTVFRIDGAEAWADYRENGVKNVITAILANPGALGGKFPPSKPLAPRVVIESYTPMTTR